MGNLNINLGGNKTTIGNKLPEIIPLFLEVTEKSDKLFGTLIQTKEKHDSIENIKKIKEYIENILKPLAKEKHTSLNLLLSGETSLSDGLYSMDFGKIAVNKGFIKRGTTLSDGTFSPHGFLFTGADYSNLIKNFPEKRCKFYLSLDLSTAIKKQKAEKFGLELVKKAKEQKISLTMKTYDHNYDSCNLYTRDIKALTEILKELYIKYEKEGIFLDVYHFLQKPIIGINPNHIGIVQEPIRNTYKSHSGRMGDLGKYLDKGETYEDACKLSFIKPDAPREIDI